MQATTHWQPFCAAPGGDNSNYMGCSTVQYTVLPVAGQHKHCTKYSIKVADKDFKNHILRRYTEASIGYEQIVNTGLHSSVNFILTVIHRGVPRPVLTVLL